MVSAVYNVSTYLPEFFASLDAQSLDHRQIEVVLVDDGSTDDSLVRCRSFAERWAGPVHVLTKPNGGQASARNLGLKVATGEWISFVDPDDMVDADFFATMLAFAHRPGNEDVSIHASKMFFLYEDTGVSEATHLLDYRFQGGDRVADLDSSPNDIHLHAATSIFRASTIEKSALRFDERIRPNFEDATFVAMLLLDQPAPRLGFVESASYFYRKRAAQNSSVDGAKADCRRYTDVLRYGYCAVLAKAHVVAQERARPIAQWAQNVVLYDLLWILKDSQHMEMRSIHFDDFVYAEFLQLVDQVLGLLTNEAIGNFSVMSSPWWCLPALLLRKNGKTHTEPWKGIDDEPRGLTSVRYLHAGERPEERLVVAGATVEARYSRELECSVLNRPFVWEREVWISASGQHEIHLDGDRQPINGWTAPIMDAFMWGSEYRPSAAAAVRSGDACGGAPRKNLTLRARIAARRFGDAWVVMDRDTAANDCGEVFYKWLRANRPDVNSYFVVRNDAPDWKRLRAEGIRPVAHGSRRWKHLMRHARHMISSQLDDYVVNPLPRDAARERPWLFTFLQHGVTKDNIFNWFNQKKIDVFVTSTEAEYDYCVGPGPSRFGNREVRLTGMPRFDDLLAQALPLPEEEQRYVLIAPTWRQYFAGAAIAGNLRALNEEFMSTRYARAWSGLLRSVELKAIAEEAGATVAFMPHPNVQPYLDLFELPEHVKVIRHADVDIRAILARSRMMITDYSSIAFDMAYLYRHVVYYQFDRDEFFGGRHVFTPGYFDYVDDGFGPVASDLDDVIKSVEAVLTGSADPAYGERMQRTFPLRDGRNCERTYQAIVAAETPQSPAEAAVAAPYETWESVSRG